MAKSSKSFVKIRSRLQIAFSFYFIKIFNHPLSLRILTPPLPAYFGTAHHPPSPSASFILPNVPTQCSNYQSDPKIFIKQRFHYHDINYNLFEWFKIYSMSSLHLQKLLCFHEEPLLSFVKAFW